MLINFLYIKFLFLIVTLLFVTMLFSKSDELRTEIDNPKFSEKGLDDRVYEIKAKKGLKKENELELFIVEGKFKTEKDGRWIYLTAEKGNYSQIHNYIELEENIIFYTDDGEKLESDHATFDMKNDVIKLHENVKHENVNGFVSSDNSTISDNFNVIIYAGNVITTIKKD